MFELKKTLFYGIFLCVFGFSSSGLSKTQAETSKSAKKLAKAKDVLAEVFKRYSSSPLVILSVEKRLKSELISKEKSYEGKMYVAKKSFRWDTETPEKSQIVYDGQHIWNVQYPPKEFKAPPQVAKMKLDKNTSKQLLFSSLFSQDGLAKNFKVQSKEMVGKDYLYKLDPIGKDFGITQLKIKIGSKEKSLNQVSYIDDIGNLTEIFIKSSQFQNKANPKLFKFIPPQGALVTNI